MVTNYKQKINKQAVLNTIKGYLFISPVLLGLLIFTLFPVVYAFINSLYTYEGNEIVTFGLQNYIKPFTDYETRRLFLKSLQVTFTYAFINIPLNLCLSFALAVFLNQKLKGMNFFRVLFYLPVLIPAVCSGLIWNNILSVDYGIANEFLVSIGLKPYTWLNDASTAMPSFIMIGLFTVGGGMILWLAQLKNIPIALYESARIEGANYFTQMFKITIPMCSPIIFYNVVLGVIGTLQTFGAVQALTGGAGPQYSLLFYVINIYDTAFNAHNLGLAEALSFILLAIIALLTFVVFKTGGWVYYGEEE